MLRTEDSRLNGNLMVIYSCKFKVQYAMLYNRTTRLLFMREDNLCRGVIVKA